MHIDLDADGPLLDAALELFGELGIARTTIGDVARKANVNRVTVYRRIGSKDELVQAVMTREATRLFEAVHAAAAARSTFPSASRTDSPAPSPRSGTNRSCRRCSRRPIPP